MTKPQDPDKEREGRDSKINTDDTALDALDSWPRLLSNMSPDELRRLPTEEYSVSELLSAAACPLRHHFEFELRIDPQLDLYRGPWTSADLTADAEGAVAHELLGGFPDLEGADLLARARQLLLQALWRDGKRIHDHTEVDRAAEAITAHVRRFRATELARRVTAARDVHREAPFVYQMRPSIRIVGAIDVAFREPDGWRVLEFKTSDDRSRSVELSATPHGLQCALYASAIQAAVWPERVKEAFVFFTDSGRSHRWPLNLSLLASWEKRAERIVDNLRRLRGRLNELQPFWTSQKCDGCPFIQLCDPIQPAAR